MKYYAPLILVKEVEVLGKTAKLPIGEWLMPVYESRAAAEKAYPNAQIISLTPTSEEQEAKP